MQVEFPSNVRAPPMPGTVTGAMVVASTATGVPDIVSPLMVSRPVQPMTIAAPSVPASVTTATSPMMQTVAMPVSPTPEINFRLTQAGAAAYEQAVSRLSPGQAAEMALHGPTMPGAVPGRCPEWQPPIAPPASLTQGLPDPAGIMKQKDDHVRGLDQNLRQGAMQLDTQHKQQRETMHAMAEKQKQQFIEQIDNQVRMQEMDLDQQFLHVLQHVKQQATRQRAQLEAQAMQLSFEYQEKKVEEDMLAHQFELSKHQNALRTRMVNTAAIPPLPSYLPPASSTQAPMQNATPSNPYTQDALTAMKKDALTPPQIVAPLGMRCNTVGASGPPVANGVLAYNQTAARYAATLSMPSNVSNMNGTLSTTAPLTATASYAPAPITMPTVSYTPPVQSPQSYAPLPPVTAPTISYTPAPVAAPTVSYTPQPVLSPQPSTNTMFVM